VACARAVAAMPRWLAFPKVEFDYAKKTMPTPPFKADLLGLL
jgi:hypothetical protein